MPSAKVGQANTAVENSSGSNMASNSMELTPRNSKSSVKPTSAGKASRELKRRSTLSEEYCFGHCGKLHQKLWFKIAIFLFLSLLNISDLSSDWLLYNDVAFTQKGLVFGPPHQDIITALLVFSIIGSITFLLESVNLGLEVFKNKGFLDVDFASAINIWFEDIPQVAINLAIAACRESEISYFQLVKAAVVIIGVIIRLILTLIRYCSKKYMAEVHQHTAESCRHVATRAFIVIGLLLMCTGSVAVFVFTQTYRSADGKITFEVPETVLQGKYDDHRYFDNVSMYFHHPSFDTSEDSALDNLNWIRIATVYNVRNATSNDTFLRYSYTDLSAATTFIMIADNIEDRGNLATRECYDLHRATDLLTSVSCPPTPDNTTFTQIVFRLHYLPAERLLRFGDIHFNVRIRYPNGTFENEAQFVDTIQGKKSAANRIFGVIHYYKTIPDVTSDTHVHSTVSRGNFSFYQNSAHLIDIDKVWRTGFIGCKATGSLAPNVKKNIVIGDQWFF